MRSSFLKKRNNLLFFKDANGNLVATFTRCKSVTATTGAVYQYYYIPATTNNCVLSTTFTKDTTYFPTKTCTYP